MSKQKKIEQKKKDKQKKEQETKKIIQELSQQNLQPNYLDNMISIQSLSKKQKKKIKLETNNNEINIQEPMQINIFQQNFENQNKIEIQEQKQQEEFNLEIAVKRICPDLTFEQQEKKKELKIIEKIQEESSESEDDFINDEILIQIQAKQNKIVKNQIIRSETQENQRRELPIYMRENEIIDAVNNNLITIISGQTGCGKSTQVPQFLYEYGYGNDQGYNPGMIGITQPRRIAAISLAQRLSEEMNFKLGNQIAYQVRHESTNISNQTKIKFQTDGILLNEMTSDFLLSKYSIIIIDEAHERKINSDLLLGLLSRVVNIRAKMALKDKISPLRLIIMSATLRIEELLQNKHLFKQKIPVIEIETRQYQVQVFYDKKTEENHLEQAIKKVIKIHQRLPNGNILVFLTGELEIKQFCYQLNQRLQSNEILSSDEDENNQIQLQKDYKIYPLYSKLSFEEQQAVFKQSDDYRMIIASTNVAETSLTIPGVRYVVDCGKQKTKTFTKGLEIMSFKIDWISQSSADQRMGRAGRIGPGICYRLYSNAVYSNIFQQHTEPEILQSPLESVILQLKAIGIKEIYQFPFPSMPDQQKLEYSFKNLQNLKAIQDNEITELGKILAYIPLAPKFSKLLLITRNFNILNYGLLLVSVLSTDEFFQQNRKEVQIPQEDIGDSDDDEFKKEINTRKYEQKIKQTELENKKLQVQEFKQTYKQYIQNKSDLFLKINILGEFMKFMVQNKLSFQEQDQMINNFAKQNKLLVKNLKEIYQNILQLIQILQNLVENKQELEIQDFFKNYQQPNNLQQNKIIESLCCIFIDKIAKKITLYNKNNQPYTAYECFEINQTVTIPAQSVVYHQKPDFVIYTHIQQNLYNNRYYLQNVTSLDEISFLYKFDYNQKDLEYVKEPKPFYNKEKDQVTVYCTYNFRQWKLPLFQFTYQNNHIEKYYNFAKFLLDGSVLDFFKALNKVYLIKIDDIKFTNLNPNVSLFVNTLKNNQVDSKQKIIIVWQKNNKFLLNEVLNLVKNQNRQGVENNWPPKF